MSSQKLPGGFSLTVPQREPRGFCFVTPVGADSTSHRSLWLRVQEIPPGPVCAIRGWIYVCVCGHGVPGYTSETPLPGSLKGKRCVLQQGILHCVTRGLGDLCSSFLTVWWWRCDSLGITTRTRIWIHLDIRVCMIILFNFKRYLKFHNSQTSSYATRSKLKIFVCIICT